MSSPPLQKYVDLIIEELEKTNKSNYKIRINSHTIFLCGGQYDVSDQNFSLRSKLLNNNLDQNVFESFVLAEKFKDYFEKGLYEDLLDFENDIASISSLIVICLESAGSLAELGMFCNNPKNFKKLLIIAPLEEVASKESFIFLGPMENIKRKEPSSVVIYPFPSKGYAYDKAHLHSIYSDIVSKLNKNSSEQKFDSENFGHIYCLIIEIINLFYPITISEVELALFAMGIDVPAARVKKYIYLLEKLEIIEEQPYSKYRYYYPVKQTKNSVRLGVSIDGLTFDSNKVKAKFKQLLVDGPVFDPKRLAALKQISSKDNGAA